MKHTFIYHVVGQTTKAVKESLIPDHHEDTYMPSKMKKSKLMSEVCEYDYHVCKQCECYNVCEYGKEWVKQNEAAIL